MKSSIPKSRRNQIGSLGQNYLFFVVKIDIVAQCSKGVGFAADAKNLPKSEVLGLFSNIGVSKKVFEG